jgi:hypothetical protein
MHAINLKLPDNQTTTETKKKKKMKGMTKPFVSL